LHRSPLRSVVLLLSQDDGDHRFPQWNPRLYTGVICGQNSLVHKGHENHEDL
jgi:hypothetical protein